MLVAPTAAQTSNGIVRSFVPLKQGVQGILHLASHAWRKESGWHRGMHTFARYVNFVGCSELAKRGYTVICADGPDVNVPHSA